jgi:hypothetical protein
MTMRHTATSHWEKTSWAAANWRLILLGIAGVVLSIASGWTTLDGMSNFTSAPVLSFLITFGIQSVLLISAWMLGEAIVNRFHSVRHAAPRTSKIIWLAALVIAALPLGIVVGSYVLDERSADALRQWLVPASIISIGILAAALVWRSWNSTNPGRALFNTAMLVTMFVACMATSVFFSFDSLFSTIFPGSERTRASEIRAKSETDAILADLISVAQNERVAAKSRLLDGPAWRDYAKRIDALRADASDQIEALESKVETLAQQRRQATQTSNRQRAELEVRQDNARRKQSGLKADLEKSRQQRQEMRAASESLKRQILQAMQRFRDAQARALEEERGIGESGKPGRGPIYQGLIDNAQRAKIDIERQQAEQAAFEKQIAELEQNIEVLEKELVAQSVALTEIESALSAINVGDGAISTLAQNKNWRAELDRKLSALATARADFEQTITKASLEKLGESCRDATQTLNKAGGQAHATCSTADLTLAAAPVFALTAGLKTLHDQCSSTGPKASTDTSVESLVSHARGCLQIAALPSDPAEDLRRRLDNIERNRDDRAHRFIVTMNAFLDGNRLAYLALAIALAIDGLIFISGLLGAATRASPFRSLPGACGHTVAGADRIMNSALMPDPGEAARLALSSIQPIPSTGQTPEAFTHQIDLGEPQSHRSAEVKRLINAAAGIGAARRVNEADNIYLLRREIVDFLALHMTSRASQSSDSIAPSWRERMMELLWRESRDAVECFGRHVHPDEPNGDFIFRLDIKDVPERDIDNVLKVLNAAAIGGGVRPVAGDGRHYQLHREIMTVVLEVTRRGKPTSSATAVHSAARKPATSRTATDQNRELTEAYETSTEPPRSTPADNAPVQSGPPPPAVATATKSEAAAASKGPTKAIPHVTGKHVGQGGTEKRAAAAPGTTAAIPERKNKSNTPQDAPRPQSSSQHKAVVTSTTKEHTPAQSAAPLEKPEAPERQPSFAEKSEGSGERLKVTSFGDTIQFD